MIPDSPLNETTENHRLLVQRIKEVLYPWRKYTIAIDGVDYSGKSTLARYLAWQLGMPAIESDLFLFGQTELPNYYWNELSKLVNNRHKLDRPLIIEGVFVRIILERIPVQPDFSIYVKCSEYAGCEEWQDAFAKYAEKYQPLKCAQFIFEPWM